MPVTYKSVRRVLSDILLPPETVGDISTEIKAAFLSFPQKTVLITKCCVCYDDKRSFLLRCNAVTIDVR